MEGTTIPSTDYTGLGSNIDQQVTSCNFFKYIEITFGHTTKQHLKDWTNTKHQLSTLYSRRLFLLCCKGNDILPRHISELNTCYNRITFYSKSCDKAFSNLKALISNRLLRLEIKDAYCYEKILTKRLEKLRVKINSLNVDKQLLDRFYSLTDEKCNKIYQKCWTLHKKKLDSLLCKKNQFSIPDRASWIKNLSNVAIPQNVIDIISLGHNFNLNSNIDRKDVITSIKNVESSIQNIDISSVVKGDIRNFTSMVLKNHTKKSTHISVEEKTLAKKVNETKKFLKDNNDIFFTRADKGSVTVCLNKNNYIDKMNILLDDINTYKKI